MIDLLFSPSGRITSGEFIKAVLILTGLTIFSHAPFLFPPNSAAESATTAIGLILMVCWVFIWIKRYRDGGYSGWMCLIPIVIYTIGAFAILGYFMWTMMDLVSDVATEFDETEFERQFRGIMLPSLMVTTVWSLVIAFGFNALIRHKPDPYGQAAQFD